jgi:hypothetical protein
MYPAAGKLLKGLNSNPFFLRKNATIINRIYWNLLQTASVLKLFVRCKAYDPENQSGVVPLPHSFYSWGKSHRLL